MRIATVVMCAPELCAVNSVTEKSIVNIHEMNIRMRFGSMINRPSL